MIKTENQIISSVLEILNTILINKNLTDWKIRQSNSPVEQGLRNKSLYLTRISSKRNGWQQRTSKYDLNAGKTINVETYIEEVLFQLSAFKKRELNNASELTSSDVMNKIITYLNSLDGYKLFKEYGFQNLKIDSLQEPVVNTDSDSYEKMPMFDFLVILVQNESENIGDTNILETDMKGI